MTKRRLSRVGHLLRIPLFYLTQPHVLFLLLREKYRQKIQVAAFRKTPVTHPQRPYVLKPATVTVNEWRRSPSSTLSAEHHGKCTLIGTRRGPGGQHRQATSWTRARRSPRSSRTSCSSSTWPSEDVLRANMIVASTAELRRGQYTCRQGWHRRQTSRAVSAYVPPQRTERHVLAQGCSCESER